MPFFKTTDGNNLHYRIAGKGKPIIFVHGWAMNSHVWKYQLDGLSRDFQVIAVDLRGHGKSRFNFQFPFETFVRDLKELIDSLAIERFTLVGWSMASFIIAKYYLKYPEDIDKLIFISGTPKFVSGAGYPHGQSMTMVKRLRKNLERDYKNHIREFCSKLFIAGENIDSDRLTEIEGLMLDEDFPPPANTALQTLNSLIQDDIRDKLKDIIAQTLIVHGDIDKICPVGAGKYMAKEIPDSKLMILKGIGHAPFLTQPEKVNKEIKDFVFSPSPSLSPTGRGER